MSRERERERERERDESREREREREREQQIDRHPFLSGDFLLTHTHTPKVQGLYYIEI